MDDREYGKMNIYEKLEMLETILNSLPFEIWYKDMDGKYLFVNQDFANNVNMKPQDCIGKKDYDVFGDTLAIKYRQADWEFLFGDNKSAQQFSKDDGSRTMEFKAGVYNEDGKYRGIVGCDLENRLDEIQALLLKDNRSMFKIVFDGSPFGMAIYDTDCPVPTKVNKKFCDIIGISEYTALNTDWRFLTYPEDIPKNESKLTEFRDNNVDTFKMEKRFIRPSGEVVWTGMTVMRLHSDPGKADLNLCILEDINERKRIENSIEYINYHDHLTDTYNRRYYESIRDTYDGERYSPLSLIMVDINNLKIVNDEEGHEAGDNLLKLTAKILKSCCDEKDILARTGGDEFTILMPLTTEKKAKERIAEIRALVAEKQSENEGYSLAIGYAVSSDGSSSVHTLFKRAEDAMYHDKV